SVRYITGKPIKFMGMGEKSDALEPFYPDRVASRILDMGDVLSLIEEAERKIDKDKAEKFADKIKKGKKFDLADFRDQLQQMQDMGGLSGVMSKLPGMSQVQNAAAEQMGDKTLKQMDAMICSMTPKERRNPDLIDNSRKRRITAG